MRLNSSDTIILFDYANVAMSPTIFRDIALLCLRIISPDKSLKSTSIYFRMYGGWFEGNLATDERYQASAFIQENFPAVISTEQGIIRLRYEFADELAAGHLERVFITHTLSSRRSAGQVRLRKDTAKCDNRDCEIKTVRKWMKKKRACTASSCALPFDAVFERREQKQVDVHLCADLIYLAHVLPPGTSVAVASDDLDIIPAIFTARYFKEERRLTVVRSLRRRNTYQDALFHDKNIEIVRYGEVEDD